MADSFEQALDAALLYYAWHLLAPHVDLVSDKKYSEAEAKQAITAAHEAAVLAARIQFAKDWKKFFHDIDEGRGFIYIDFNAFADEQIKKAEAELASLQSQGKNDG